MKGDISAKKSLGSFIRTVLPHLSDSDQKSTLDTLGSLGIETFEDFHYVKETDLMVTLKPIEARRLIRRFPAMSKYLI